MKDPVQAASAFASAPTPHWTLWVTCSEEKRVHELRATLLTDKNPPHRVSRIVWSGDTLTQPLLSGFIALVWAAIEEHATIRHGTQQAFTGLSEPPT
jgi:hypothetical protein